MGDYTRIIDLQNLQRAWEKVHTNHPAAGSDHISAEHFENRKKEYLYQLHVELKTGKYIPQVVKQIEIFKNGKARTISLFCMRDKVVQQSICTVLGTRIEQEISPRAFAYRNGKSALVGIDEIEKEIKEKQYSYFLKMDIEKYFDSVDIEQCIFEVSKLEREKEVVELLEKCVRTPCLDLSGNIQKKVRGLYQGSVLSPILSNLYLANFDKVMEKKTQYYLRYSDDMLVLGKDPFQLEQIKQNAKEELDSLGLKLKESKTSIVSASKGVEFLGILLTNQGKNIPNKAKLRLREKLEDIWFSSEYGIEDKLRKGKEILGGWEQYYNMEREIGDMIEYAIVFAYAYKQNDSVMLQQLKRQRKNYVNIYKENVLYFAKIWKEQEEIDLLLFEYEQFFQLDKADEGKVWKNEEEKKSVIQIYETLVIREDVENLTELMQSYADCHMYNKAQMIAERIQRLGAEWKQEKTEEERRCCSATKPETISLNEKEKQCFIQRFVGREDTYGVATVKLNGKYKYEQIKSPFTEEVLEKHLQGKQTVATYIQRNNDTVHTIVFDIDVSKKVLLQTGRNDKCMQQYMKNAKTVTRQIMTVLKKMGICGYVEYSGYRGYHIWIFLKEWISVKYCNLFQDCVVKQSSDFTSEGISIECFPNKKRVKEGQLGQLMKLPWGQHYFSGERTYFVDETFQTLENQKRLLEDVEEYDVEIIKRIIVAHTGENFAPTKSTKVEGIEEFGTLADEVKLVLEKCGLQRYLCLKAKRTGYLSHFERLTILYVFGHLGEAGKDFIHQVMEYTLNYQYAVTERFIRKCPKKPISCIKLREQYKQVTAEVGCNCNFRRTKNCYPSPVLHVVTEIGEVNTGVTMPTAKKISKEKEKDIYEEINIHAKVGELVKKLMELKKQNRGVEKAIKKQEEELEKIFNQTKVECMELEVGLLKRVQTPQGSDWVIEL
ncbi:MAG: CRISPR-associated primase-polymerase type A1 [Lachnospiraceae bacterium]|nr:CRISPR-associated primase-polymerase type A1 [Lachnospiraceae bacterium]